MVRTENLAWMRFLNRFSFLDAPAWCANKNIGQANKCHGVRQYGYYLSGVIVRLAQLAWYMSAWCCGEKDAAWLLHITRSG